MGHTEGGGGEKSKAGGRDKEGWDGNGTKAAGGEGKAGNEMK